MVMSEEDQKAKKKRWPASSVFSEKRGERLRQRIPEKDKWIRIQLLQDDLKDLDEMHARNQVRIGELVQEARELNLVDMGVQCLAEDLRTEWKKLAQE